MRWMAGERYETMAVVVDDALTSGAPVPIRVSLSHRPPRPSSDGHPGRASRRWTASWQGGAGFNQLIYLCLYRSSLRWSLVVLLGRWCDVEWRGGKDDSELSQHMLRAAMRHHSAWLTQQ